MTLKPQFLTRNGKPEYVVLPYDQFEEMQARLEDAADLIALDRARREDAGKPTISLEEMKRRLGMRTGRKSRRKPADRRRRNASRS
jgi:PHD/YefM family antitoxin component YafN of YafNO toxin-antitoxin module